MATTIIGERTFALQQVLLKDARKNAYNGIVSIPRRVDFNEAAACEDIAVNFSESDSYSAGDFAYFEGELYQALEDVQAGAFDSEKWIKSSLSEYITGLAGKIQ